MTSVSSLITPLLTQDSRDKRISECGFPSTAVKVDSPYQSYMNHPFTQQQQQQQRSAGNKPSNNQTAQAFIIKYNSYTNSSKNIRLITIPASNISVVKKSKSSMNDMSNLSSPTSPLISPPPPYLHTDHRGEVKSKFEFDSKTSRQQQLIQWPSMMKLSSNPDVTTANLTQPKLARVLPPQAIPISTRGPYNLSYNDDKDETYASPTVLSPSRTSHFMDTKGNETLYTPQYQQVVHSHANVSATLPSSQTGLVHSISYPFSIWDDIHQSKMHWVLLPFGCAMLGSSIWVIIMHVFMEWLIVAPILTFIVFAMQFGSYRRKKTKFLNQQRNDTSAVAATKSIDQSSDLYAFLQPHQPSQTDYFNQPLTIQPQMQHVRSQEPFPISSPPPFEQQLYKQPRVYQSTKKPSQQQQSQQRHIHPGLRRGSSNGSPVNNSGPYCQNPDFLPPVNSPQTPPPAYVLKMIELPVIDSIGNLVSEFEKDFDTIRY
ncbi:hypothetical protein BGZ49_009341 [Haplosporangium sp. Z 27]|nr:hypothetical protein BGZ49_009341 [Haplosporangium sp. Z 27]